MQTWKENLLKSTLSELLPLTKPGAFTRLKSSLRGWKGGYLYIPQEDKCWFTLVKISVQPNRDFAGFWEGDTRGTEAEVSRNTPFRLLHNWTQCQHGKLDSARISDCTSDLTTNRFTELSFPLSRAPTRGYKVRKENNLHICNLVTYK
jgi:hypothetical protein